MSRNPQAQKFHHVLNALTADELRQFVCTVSETDDYALRSFKAFYTDKFEAGRSDCEALIQRCLKPMKNADFAGDDSDVAHLLVPVNLLVDSAWRYADQQKFVKALEILQPAFDQVDAIFNSDVEADALYDCVKRILDMFDEIADQLQPGELRRACFTYFRDSMFKKIHSSWAVSLASLAAKCAGPQEEGEFMTMIMELRKILDVPHEGDEEDVQGVILHYIERNKPLDDLREFLTGRLKYRSFRFRRARLEWKQGNIGLAIDMIHDALVVEGRTPGSYVVDWYEMLLTIHEEQGDAQQAAMCAQMLFDLDTYGDRYLPLLKKWLSPEEWAMRVDECITTLRRADNQYSLARLFADEGRIEELYLLLKNTSSFQVIREYEHVLLPQYRQELQSTYFSLILYHLHSGDYSIRNEQQTIGVLTNMVGLYDKGAIKDFVKNLQSRFESRQDLVGELDVFYESL